MTRTLILTDDLLRRALTPSSGVQTPAGLLAEVLERIDRMPRRAGLLARLGDAADPWSTGLRWALVAAGAVLALALGLLYASGTPEPLRPFRDITFADSLTLRIAAMDGDEAWVAAYGGQLWHRTAAGWSGPEAIGTNATRGVAALPDGRVVVTSDHGTWARDPVGGWAKLNIQPSSGIVAAPDGTVWVAGSAAHEKFIDAYRVGSTGWERTRASCPAGGWQLALGAHGTVWSAGIGYNGTGGLARLDGPLCLEVRPFGGDRGPEVIALAASADGAVAITEGLPAERPDEFRGETSLFDGTTWTVIRTDDMAIPWRLAFGPSDELYAGLMDGIWRYRDGAWTLVVPGAVYEHLYVTPDGTMWYVTESLDGTATLNHVAIQDLPR